MTRRTRAASSTPRSTSASTSSTPRARTAPKARSAKRCAAGAIGRAVDEGVTGRCVRAARAPPSCARASNSSLERLGTDYVDIFHLHGVLADQYAHCVDVLLPELVRARDAGKIRFIGITERFGTDTDHAMLEARAARRSLRRDHGRPQPAEPVGAADRCFRLTRRERRRHADHVRGAPCVDESRERARAVVAQLIEAGAIDARASIATIRSASSPRIADVKSLVEAAYRFCRYERGAHVILTGTGSVEHLRENVDSILAPPLPSEITRA